MFDLKRFVEDAPLGDTRRNLRALEIVTALIQGGTSASSDSTADEKETRARTMGCCRFFDNSHLALPNLYEPSRHALAALVPPGERAYVIYDISTVDYSHHEAKEDRIQIGNAYGLGYELFSALLLDAQGRPLGPVMQELRTAQGCLSSEAWEPIPFVDHYEQVERASQALRVHLPERDLVEVMDREFDDVALHRQLSDTSKKYIIRAQHLDRKVLLWGRPTTLRNAVRAAPRVVAGIVERQGKHYELRLAETFVTFHGRSWRGHKRGQPTKLGTRLSVRVVVVELHHHGRRAHQWVLLTNLDEPTDMIGRIYTWRWRVERLFFLIKVGMRIEHWKEQTGERIARRLALYTLAATVIYQLQAAAGDEAYADMIRTVATLGGWLGRKRDPIGPIVLMRGMLRLLGSLALLEELGPKEMRRLGKRLAQGFGVPVPGVTSPRKKPRRATARPSLRVGMS